MDIKEYIASGIVEGYVLGSLSDQERREVECMSAIYPEIKAKVLEAQQTFEKYAESISVTPPSHLKASILEKIRSTEQEQVSSTNKTTEPKIVSIAPTTKKSNFSTFVAAASVLLLICSLALYYFEHSEKTQLAANLSKYKETNTTQKKQVEEMSETLAMLKSTEELMMASNTQMVKLSGTPMSPVSEVRVYYNPSQKAAALSIEKLPMPDESKQYQLWALVDGKPMDLGMIEMNEDTKMIPMLPVEMDNIQAFAITLEKKGGSPTPNLEQLYVIGNLQ